RSRRRRGAAVEEDRVPAREARAQGRAPRQGAARRRRQGADAAQRVDQRVAADRRRARRPARADRLRRAGTLSFHQPGDLDGPAPPPGDPPRGGEVQHQLRRDRERLSRAQVPAHAAQEGARGGARLGAPARARGRLPHPRGADQRAPALRALAQARRRRLLSRLQVRPLRRGARALLARTLMTDRSKKRLMIAAALACALAFRFALVASWHKPGGDGVQYYRMAQELRRANRLAFAPPPAPLAYSRLPGYPVFLAYVGAPGRSWGSEQHVVAAVIWNVLLDLGTALLVLLILRERKLDERAGRAGFVLVLACPTLWLVYCYALTETMSGFLGTLEIYLAVRAMRTRPLLNAALAGVVAGVSQLVRADALTFAPGVAIALAAMDAPPRRRLAALGAFGAAAIVAFSPWPLRNLARFGAAHPFSSTWRQMDGTPLGDGTMEWTRTWSSSQPGEAFFD